jgi:hypothetical protein
MTETVTVKTIVFDKKREKAFDKALKLANRAIFNPPRQPMTAEERREMRAEQQRARRAAKALGSVIL